MNYIRLLCKIPAKLRSVFILITAFLLLTGNGYAQLSGTYAIPGQYATIADAVTALNTSGVSGAVTFKVLTDHQETAPAAGILLGTPALNATTSVTNTITFQRDGMGLNPQIYAFTPGTSTTVDGIFKILGTDYVTIDGIDLYENNSNTTPTMRMEWGYALVKGQGSTPFDGCQYVTIKNCNINLNKANTASVGIYVGNHIYSITTSLTITAATDATNNCKFFNNTIQNAYTGIRLGGYAASTPYTLYDQNNEVGVDGANTISNFGGSSSPTYGLYAIYQAGLKVANNSITLGTGTTTTAYGISISTATSANVDIYNNTVQLASSATTTTLYGISNSAGGTAASNTINIYNNTVQNSTYATATSGSFTAIVNSGSAATANIYSNIVTGNSFTGTGAFTGIDGGGPTNLNMYSNYVYNNQKTGASGIMYLTRGSTAIVTYHSNNVYDNGFTASSGTSSCIIYGYYNLGSLRLKIFITTIFIIYQLPELIPEHLRF
ncbi:MAG: hypothetical protein K8H86_07925 [Ignavibacteriaceae bacterium]|nr:hypothetical protein [Ignavibacteriaceae bacterium]